MIHRTTDLRQKALVLVTGNEVKNEKSQIKSMNAGEQVCNHKFDERFLPLSPNLVKKCIQTLMVTTGNDKRKRKTGK